MSEPAPLRLTTSGIAKGGRAVGRGDDGRVVFVAGALPDEKVQVELTSVSKRFAEGRVVSVDEPSPHRIDPPCPEAVRGCGGCDFQHASIEEQRRLKEIIVIDALERIGKLEHLPSIRQIDLPASAYRTTVRCLVVDGKAAFRARASHEPVRVAECGVCHPLVEDLIVNGDFGRAKEVTIRVGAATGERMVRASPTAEGVRLPDDVVVVGDDELRAGASAFIHEEVAGRIWRISAGSFFQARPDGAAALTEAASDAIGDVGPVRRAIDLYGGVGLFAGTTLAQSERIELVESSRSSVADAQANLADLPVRFHQGRVEGWAPHRADLVVADPARRGLGRAGVDQVSHTDAATLVLVSCDAASLARDAELLGRRGYGLTSLTMVDLFPMTSHTETVARFDVR